MDLPRVSAVVPPALATRSRTRATLVRQPIHPTEHSLQTEPLAHSYVSKAKPKMHEEVTYDCVPRGVPDDAEVDETGVIPDVSSDSATLVSSGQPNHHPHAYFDRPLASGYSASLEATEASCRKPSEGAGVYRGERKRQKALKHASEEDDDVQIVSATVPQWNQSRDQKKSGHASTADDAAIALMLQEEEEEKEKRASRSTTTSSSPSTSVQHDLVSNDYELALRLQQSWDKEIAPSLHTDVARHHHGSHSGAEGRHSLYRPHSASRHRLGPQRSQLHPLSAMGLGGVGHFPTPHAAYSHRGWSLGDSMSYEALLELEDIPVGMSKQAIASHSTAYTFNVASAGASTHQTCSICLESFTDGQKLRVLPCLHLFHCPCVDKWLSRSKQCPMCLKDIEELH